MNSGGMVSLVNFLGDERIKFQVVHRSMDGNVTMLKDGGTRFTMVTEQANLTPADVLTDKPRKYGLLLWVDAEDYKQWHEQKAGSAEGGNNG